MDEPWLRKTTVLGITQWVLRILRKDFVILVVLFVYNTSTWHTDIRDILITAITMLAYACWADKLLNVNCWNGLGLKVITWYVTCFDVAFMTHIGVSTAVKCIFNCTTSVLFRVSGQECTVLDGVSVIRCC